MSRPGLDLDAHYLVSRAPNTQFFHYFGLLSNNCWRRLPVDLPARTCFCGGPASDRDDGARNDRGSAASPKSKSSDKKVMNFLVDRLGLSRQPPPPRIRVGLISRRRKRFILNEHELVEAALGLGVEVQILSPARARTSLSLPSVANAATAATAATAVPPRPAPPAGPSRR